MGAHQLAEFWARVVVNLGIVVESVPSMTGAIEEGIRRWRKSRKEKVPVCVVAYKKRKMEECVSPRQYIVQAQKNKAILLCPVRARLSMLLAVCLSDWFQNEDSLQNSSIKKTMHTQSSLLSPV
jgi:hypothetical protein